MRAGAEPATADRRSEREIIAYIDLGPDEQSSPGIVGLLRFRPETAGPLNQLAESLLCGTHALTRGERELIAAYVSSLNGCTFCCSVHSAAAAAQLDGGSDTVKRTFEDLDDAPVSARLRALLSIARAVQQAGRAVSEEMVQIARDRGATDVEIHDTVLIAAAFCMFNRYVDGLGTATMRSAEDYEAAALRIVHHGYVGA